MSSHEALLLNYGVLGAWTAMLLWEKKVLLTKMTKALEKLENTIQEAMRE